LKTTYKTKIANQNKKYFEKFGETIQYLRFDETLSAKDDVYDEGAKLYLDSVDLKVTIEDTVGNEQFSDLGSYIAITADFRVSKKIFTEKIEVEVPSKKDRFIYEGNTYTIFYFDDEGRIENERFEWNIRGQKLV
jgi:hypothetical protein